MTRRGQRDDFVFEGFASPPYTQVPNELFDLLMPKISDSALRVLLYLIRRTLGFGKNSDQITVEQMLHGIITEDGRRLDGGTGITNKKTLRRALAELERGGMIVVERRSGAPTAFALKFRATGRMPVDSGQSVDPDQGLDPAQQMAPVQQMDPVQAAVREGDQLVGGDQDQLVAPTKERGKKDRKKDQDGQAALFEKFWTAYPKKVAKKAAGQAFEKLNPGPELLDDILTALDRQKQAQQWQRDGGQYVPNPTTWLNGRRWEDEMPASGHSGNRQFDSDEFERRVAERGRR